MSLNPFDAIEKLINEHGSAEILKARLELAKDQYNALENNAKELLEKVAELKVKLEMEQATHGETKQELQRLRDEHAEEVRVHKGIEFRRGKRTGGKWIAFCPVCHAPADTTALVMCANQKCKWRLIIPGKDVPKFVAEFSGDEQK